MVERVILKGNSRLHLSLLSMFDSKYRINGGIGLSLDNPSLEIISEKAECNFFSYGNENVTDVVSWLDDVCSEQGFNKKISAKATSYIPFHQGFGSGTALRLSLLESLFILNEREYTEAELVLLSGRGGTSGIGVNAYFKGGAIFDLGHSARRISDSLLRPSFMGGRSELPLMMSKFDMPDWEVGICISNKLRALSHEEEEKFFSASCPINEEAVYKTVYLSLFGIAACILERDYWGFCEAVNDLQITGWKSKERAIYGDGLNRVEKILKRNGADAVGLSSLGPSLFFLSQDVSSVVSKCKRYRELNVFRAKFVNAGRVVKCA